MIPLRDTIPAETYPAMTRLLIAANVAIVADRGQSTLDASRPYLEKWLHGLTAKSGQVRVHAERRMTAGFTVGKVKKAWPAATLLSDKAWGKFFAETEDYQSVRVDYLPDARASAGTEIVKITFGCTQRENMGLSEINNVDVIADAGAVRRFVIVPEHLYGGTLAQRRLQDQRNQVRFRIVMFADQSAFIRARCVEIPERHELKSF